jgi:xanthine dehydrogenase large subunit
VSVISEKRGAFRTGVNTAQLHDSASRHVAGTAVYIDDMPEPPELLHAALVLSEVAHARIVRIDAAAARAMPGVAAVLTAQDVPGQNDIGPIGRGEPLFADPLIEHFGQPVAIVAATSLDAARAAAAKVVVAVEALPPILTIDAAVDAGSFLAPPLRMERGSVDAALAAAPHRLRNRLRVGGQEHFYLETQIALAIPGEDGDITVHSSTQHPSEVQHICARVLGCAYNKITSVVRRLGGGFGGKESNASWVAAAACLVANRLGRPVKLRLPREVDMLATGKRHAFRIDYDLGYDDEGRFLALETTLAALGGHVLDHTASVMTRSLCTFENVYYLPHVRAIGLSCKTNTVSNTAFRGYGTPQGVVILEDAVERIAIALGKTPEAIRAINFYGGEGRDITPSGQKLGDNLIERCVAQVMRDADWDARRAAVDDFNRTSPIIKRGLGMFPLKFGVSFNSTVLNQAGAFVNIYSDGSIRLSHGGTEMGQGLYIKVAQVVAEVLQVDIDRIALSATTTGEVPNTAPTAGSTGSDLNGWAAHAAATTIKDRMIEFLAGNFGAEPAAIEFRDNHVHIGTGSNHVLSFDEVAKLCWLNRVSLSATGFYKTPDITWDPATMTGSPFYYFVYGAAVAEVAIDTLTGESRVLRADLVEDCGRPLNPAVDLGQIEGGFVQGLGWLTTEELWWDEAARLRTVGPSTYKIPGSRDVPPVLNVRILEDAPARSATIYRSKGVGEPPIVLATAISTALRDALGSLAGKRVPVQLDAPATPERILMEAQRLRRCADTLAKESKDGI